MPIERDGKHWCDPAAETPDENGSWSCSCGKVWTWDAAERTWTPAEYFTTRGTVPAPEAEPVPPAADTKRKTRARKAGAE